MLGGKGSKDTPMLLPELEDAAREGGGTKKASAHPKRRSPHPRPVRLLEDDGKPLRVIAWESPRRRERDPARRAISTGTVVRGPNGRESVRWVHVGTEKEKPTVIPVGEKENFVWGLLRRMPDGPPFSRRDVLLAAGLLEVDESGHVEPPTITEEKREKRENLDRLRTSIELRARVYAIQVAARSRGWTVAEYVERVSRPTDGTHLRSEILDYVREKQRLLQVAGREAKREGNRLAPFLEAERASVRRQLIGKPLATARKPGRPREPRLSRRHLEWLTERIRAARVPDGGPVIDAHHELGLAADDVERLEDKTLALMIQAQTRAVLAGRKLKGKAALLRAARSLAQLLDS
jgi:hypothetical protein